MCKNKKQKQKEWWKTKPYTHISRKVGFQHGTPNNEDKQQAIQKFKHKIIGLYNSSSYNFFPLLKYIQKERRYKKVQCKSDFHYLVNDKNKYIRKASKKERVIEFATHIDTQILAYLASQLSEQYEINLTLSPNIDRSVIGYRRIENAEGKGKNNVELAADFFDEILSFQKDAYVLTFDIKDFFPSLNHKILFDVWANLYSSSKLSPQQYHAFKAIAQYAYFEKEDLRNVLYSSQKEAEKAFRRNIEKGVDAYFESPRQMREAIRSGKLHIHKNTKSGIPHGLPVSATLANVYMWNFDKKVSELVYKKDGQYRRYSDDIIVLIPKDDAFKKEVENTIREGLKELKLKISEGKTEEYSINYAENGDVRVEGHVKVKKYHKCTRKCQIEGIAENDTGCMESDTEKKLRDSLHYLGLEFFGRKNGEKLIFIKLTTLAKFQNKMRDVTHRFVRRAYKRAERDCMPEPTIFYNSLRRKFTFMGIKKGKFPKKVKLLKWQHFRGVYDFETKERNYTPKYGGSLSYVRKFDKYVYQTPKGEMGKGQKQFKRIKLHLFRELKKAKEKYR